MSPDQKPDCAVIGAGIIGICCGISLLEQGYSVTLYDPQPPGSMTSSGNAGGFGFTDVVPMAGPGLLWRVPKWLLDPHGPLFIRPGHFPALLPWLIRFQKMSNRNQVERLSHALSALLKQSMTDSRELIRKAGLQSLFTEKGAITVYKTREGFEKDALEWQIKMERGVDARELGREQIRDMEPALENARFGWFTPQWCNTTDPYAFVSRLSEYYLAQGGAIINSEVGTLNRSDRHVHSITMVSGQTIDVSSVVVAAGAWSKALCKQLAERVLLESERGYNTTLPNPGVSVEHEVIFGEEKFVITPIGDGLRIGGAAEFAGLKTPPNYRRSEILVNIARRYLPGLDDSGGEKWMGHRPSTPDSIPVIGPSSRFDNVYYAFGHGHYGLTMAATTGKLVAASMRGERTGIDLDPYSINRFS